MRRYPHDSFSRASRSTTDRTLWRTGGRPGRVQQAQRRRRMSRCQRPGQQRQPCPVRPCQPRMSPRPLTQGDRKLMAQHEDLGIFHHDPGATDSAVTPHARRSGRSASSPQAENRRTLRQVGTAYLPRYQTRHRADGEMKYICPGGIGCRVAGGISAPGSHGTVRNNLSLHGSCRSGHQTAGIQVTQAQWAKKRGRCRTALFHASCALRRPRSRLCFLRSQRSK